MPAIHSLSRWALVCRSMRSVAPTHLLRLFARMTFGAAASWSVVVAAFAICDQHDSTPSLAAFHHEIGVAVSPQGSTVYHVAGKSRSHSVDIGTFTIPVTAVSRDSQSKLRLQHEASMPGIRFYSTDAAANPTLLISSERQTAVESHHAFSLAVIISIVITLYVLRRSRRRKLMTHDKTVRGNCASPASFKIKLSTGVRDGQACAGTRSSQTLCVRR